MDANKDISDQGGDGDPLDAESDSRFHCEGEVVTCAHCGRPATECDGSRCEHLLETRDWMLPGYSSA